MRATDLVRVERHPAGRRVWIGPVRWHHYTSGFALIGLGAYLIVWDRRDLAAVFRRGYSLDRADIGVTTNVPGGW